jgi:hypothetical protein
MSITNTPFLLIPAVGGDNGSVAALDAAEKFIVCVIRAPKTGTLQKICWRSGAVSGASYTLKISLETVAEVVGQPVATTNASKTLFSAGAESADITSVTANTVYYTPINGSTGISVTKGDLIAVTFRLLAVSASSVQIKFFNSTYMSLSIPVVGNTCYTATYLGSAWAVAADNPNIALEYTDELVPTLYTQPIGDYGTVTYNSGSANTHIGLKFKLPFKSRLAGCMIFVDLDGDANAILYGADEYTALATVALKNTQRRQANRGWIQMSCTSDIELEANTDYRMVIVPTTATDIILSIITFTDDGAIPGITSTREGEDFIYTSRSSAPSAGDHSWTDSVTVRSCMSLILDGIELGSAAGGGNSVIGSGIIKALEE